MSEFVRVSKQRPCPICKKPDWCMVSKDGAAAICPRVPSSRDLGEAGFLHRLTEQAVAPPSCFKPVTVNINPTAIASRYQEAMTGEDYWHLAANLGVTEEALMALSVGRADQYLEGTYSFPMRNEWDQIVGIRLRNKDGHKWAVYGSKQGLFYGSFEVGETLYVCEGPTDAAALISQGCAAIGKPSCSSGDEMVVAIVRKVKPSMVVVVSDVDHHTGKCNFCDRDFCQHCRPGQYGAEKTARAIHATGAVVKVVEPINAKDIRQWFNKGATKAGLRMLVDNTLLWTPRYT